jgi:NADPH:quinone reductase-like Zn-dependent oxidoreductase
MKAAVCTAYGPPEVLRIQDVAKPVPRSDEVLVKVHAAAVTSSDWLIRNGMAFAALPLRIAMRLALGITRPRKAVLGLVPAGEIEETGRAVTRFRAGERVVAFTELRFGAYAEYVCLRETAVLGRAPSNLTYEEAAAIPYGGLLALHYLGKGDVRGGRRVLVYGASGAIGTSAVQLAKDVGAHVTAVCSTTNLDLVRSLGADAVLDYTKQDAPPEGEPYDFVLDAVGKRKTSPLKVASRRALAPDGKYVSVDDGMPRMTAAGLAKLTELAEAGRLRPIIDRRYALDAIVEAHRYVEQDHKKGNVVLTVSSP